MVAATEQPDEIDCFLESMVRDLPGSWTYLPEERMLALLLQDNVTVPMCGPLRITTRICSADKKSWARRISFLDHDGELHSETIPDKDLQGSARSLCARLAAHGLAIEGAHRYIFDLIRHWPVHSTLHTVDHPGWHRLSSTTPVYLRPDGQAFAQPNGNHEPLELASPTDPAGSSGTLEGWQQTIGRYAIGNPALICAISAALTGPLLRFTETEGVIGLNFYARTSSGKTTTLIAAQSCLGAPQHLRRWNATPLALEQACHAANDGAILLDEFPAQPSPETTAVLYMIGNGTGRANARKAGPRWLTVALSTSERPIRDLLSTSGKPMPAGIGVRFLDIPARSWEFGLFANLHGTDSGHELAVAVQTAARENYGHVLPAFVRELVLDPDILHREIADDLPKCRRFLFLHLGLSETEPDGVIQRVLSHLALIATAGEIASRLQILPWPPFCALNAVCEIAALWYQAHRTCAPMTPDAAIDRLRSWLGQNAQRLTPPGRARGDGSAGWQDEHWLWLDPLILKQEIFSEASEDGTLRGLCEAGILIPGGEKKSWQYRLPRAIDPERSRVYRLDQSRI